MSNDGFDPHGGAVVEAALDLASSAHSEGEPRRPAARRRGDALVDLCQWFLDHYPAGAKRRRRPDRNVVADLDDLDAGIGSLVQGTPLDHPRLRAGHPHHPAPSVGRGGRRAGAPTCAVFSWAEPPPPHVALPGLAGEVAARRGGAFHRSRRQGVDHPPAAVTSTQ